LAIESALVESAVDAFAKADDEQRAACVRLLIELVLQHHGASSLVAAAILHVSCGSESDHGTLQRLALRLRVAARAEPLCAL